VEETVGKILYRNGNVRGIDSFRKMVPAKRKNAATVRRKRLELVVVVRSSRVKLSYLSRQEILIEHTTSCLVRAAVWRLLEPPPEPVLEVLLCRTELQTKTGLVDASSCKMPKEVLAMMR